MKVYVVLWTQSYDGPLFEGVFRTREQAETFVKNETSSPYTQSSFYEIEEHELDGT